eukprot:434892-Hanusia_phi.AAC.1
MRVKPLPVALGPCPARTGSPATVTVCQAGARPRRRCVYRLLRAGVAAAASCHRQHILHRYWHSQ